MYMGCEFFDKKTSVIAHAGARIRKRPAGHIDSPTLSFEGKTPDGSVVEVKKRPGRGLLVSLFIARTEKCQCIVQGQITKLVAGTIGEGDLYSERDKLVDAATGPCENLDAAGPCENLDSHADGSCENIDSHADGSRAFGTSKKPSISTTSGTQAALVPAHAPAPPTPDLAMDAMSSCLMQGPPAVSFFSTSGAE